MENTLKTLKSLNRINTTHVIQFPSGKWGFVGSVPADLYYVDGASQKDIDNARQFGERFGPKRRVFETKEAAIAKAAELGYPIANA